MDDRTPGRERYGDERWFLFDPDGTILAPRWAGMGAILAAVRAISIPARFGPGQAAEWIDAWAQADGMLELRVALPASANLEPAGIVLLAAAIARRATRGLRTWMSIDGAAGDALHLLEGVDFFRELGVEPEGVARGSASNTWVSLRRIASLEIGRRQADATRELLERTVPSMPPSTVRAAQFVFEELAANIVQHSGATDTGFGLAIADPAKKRIQIAFCDAGIGFLASLQSNPEFAGRVADDAQAIRLALDQRVTRAGSGNIEMGLFLLSSFAERVKGDLWIATGDAILVRQAGGEKGRVERIERTAGWQGAFLCLDAPVPGW